MRKHGDSSTLVALETFSRKYNDVINYINILSYSIIYNKIGFNCRIPRFSALVSNFFGRLLPHAFNNFQQLFQKTSLTQRNSDTVICSHVGIYMAISLNKATITYLTTSCTYRKRFLEYQETKALKHYPHQIKYLKGFLRFPRHPQNS